MVAAVAGSSGSMRSSILPPSKPIRAIAGRVVAGEPVVDLEHGPGQAAAVHRADDHLVVQRAEQQQVLEDVRRCRARRRRRAGPAPRTAARAARPGRPWPCGRSPTRSAPRAGWSAAMMNSWPSSPSSGRGRRRCAAAASAIALGPPGADVEDGPRRSRIGHACGRPVQRAPRPRRPWASRRSRPAGTRRWPRRRSRTASSARASQPASSPWHSAPPNASPAPRPLTTSTGTGGTSTATVPVVREHALGALLDDRELDAEGVQRLRGRGQRLALADRGLALVEVADRHGDMRQRPLRPASPGRLPGRPEHRPVVQVEHGDAAPGRGPPGRPGWRSGSAPRTARCRSPRTRPPTRSRPGPAPRRGSPGPAPSASGRSRAGSRPAGRSRRTSPGWAAPAPAVTYRSSTP